MTSPGVNMSLMSTKSSSVNGTSPKPVITTRSLPTATAAPAPDSTIQLGFSLNQNFEPEFADKNSQKFKDLANKITAVLDNIYKNKFGRRFLRSLIRSFRQGSVVVDSELIFANASSVPVANLAQTTLVEAASNSSNFSLPVNVSTIVAAAQTAAPNATVTSPAVNMTTLRVNMTSSRVNMTSPSVNMTSPRVNVTSPGLDNIYKNKFGRRFLRSLIRSFRQGSVVVDSELIFANASSVPVANLAQTTLVEAASNSSNFSLPVNVSTIVAVNMTSPRVNVTSPGVNVTSPRVNMTSPRVNMTSPQVNMTSPRVNMTSPGVNMSLMSTKSSSVNGTSPKPVITTGSLPTATAAPAPDSTIQLGFSLNQNFEPEFADKNSQKFKDLANKITAVLDNIYKNKFGRRFLRSLIRSFRQGSVVVDSELIFANASSVPVANLAQTTLVEAASNSSNFSLPVNVSTIVAAAQTAAPNATVTSPAVNMTTLRVNMTSSRVNMTSPSVNMTSPREST
ncbi:uncharacterized protein LOC134132706 [Pungitius pungitius]|uniref:uncharacterized protein LOC134132706 n=1 Tax=Pungitius pungitius TaxID=134920 RepID=UPI002E166BC0